MHQLQHNPEPIANSFKCAGINEIMELAFRFLRFLLRTVDQLHDYTITKPQEPKNLK